MDHEKGATLCELSRVELRSFILAPKRNGPATLHYSCLEVKRPNLIVLLQFGRGEATNINLFPVEVNYRRTGDSMVRRDVDTVIVLFVS